VGDQEVSGIMQGSQRADVDQLSGDHLVGDCDDDTIQAPLADVRKLRRVLPKGRSALSPAELENFENTAQSKNYGVRNREQTWRPHECEALYYRG
jgi:hypothetical protein